LGDDARNDGHLIADFIFDAISSSFEAYLLFRTLLGLEILVRLLVGHDDDMILFGAGSCSAWRTLPSRSICAQRKSCFVTRSLLSDSFSLVVPRFVAGRDYVENGPQKNKVDIRDLCGVIETDSVATKGRLIMVPFLIYRVDDVR
jgi:hypothetical protein